MSMNYYARTKDSPTLEDLHIGKHSDGWEFLWRAHRNQGLVSAASWYEFLNQAWVTIVDDCNTVLTLDEFWQFATERPYPVGRSHTMRTRFADVKGGHGGWEWFRDEAGYPFADYEFC